MIGVENRKADIEAERRKILDGTYPLRIIAGRQNKHIEGTREFEQNREKMRKLGSRPSILIADAQMLADKFKGTGIIYFTKSSADYPREDIDAGYVIGKFWDWKTQRYVDTTVFTISYSKTGIHIFPNDKMRSE